MPFEFSLPQRVGFERPVRPRPRTLFEQYVDAFEIAPAVTPELIREAHRIRYQVYCLEHDYEDPEQCPDGLERDEYDDHSLQGVLLHRKTGAAVGAVRLVMPLPGAAFGSLPFHAVCATTAPDELMALPLHAMAEISRFSVSKSYRQRAIVEGQGRQAESDAGEAPASLSLRYIALGLIAVVLKMGSGRGMTHVCAVMEPPLLRMLARLGIHFHPLGPLVDYHGRRQPCYSDADELFGRLMIERPDVWEVVTNGGTLWQPKHPALALAK